MNTRAKVHRNQGVGALLLSPALLLIACFLIGFPTAYYIATLPERKKYMWVLLITVPYWINLLIRTIAMLFLVRNEGPLNHVLMS